MTDAIAVSLIGVLAGISALHLYWAGGGRWPGIDDESFVKIIIGRTKNPKPPSPLVCASVAAALAASAIMVSLKADLFDLEAIPRGLVVFGFWLSGAAFFIRGLIGFVAAMTRYAAGTPFYRLNRIVYSPLCLALSLGFVCLEFL